MMIIMFHPSYCWAFFMKNITILIECDRCRSNNSNSNHHKFFMKLWNTRSLLIINIFLYYAFIKVPTLALAADTQNAKIVPDDKLKKSGHPDNIVPPVLDDDDDEYDFEEDYSSKNTSGTYFTFKI
jgi:hypothetical protein